MFEGAASFRLIPKEARWTSANYPKLEEERAWSVLGFRSLEDDVRTCCRQYFIPSPGDFARMRRAPPQVAYSAWKWNASTGIPLGEVAAPVIPGQPRKLAGWPDFHRLLVALDQGCAGRFGRLWEKCPVCRGVSSPSYFTMYALSWERIQRLGSTRGPSWGCRLWSQHCLGKPLLAEVPTTARNRPTSEASRRTPTASSRGEEVSTPIRSSARSISTERSSYADLEAQLREARRTIAALDRVRAPVPAPPISPQAVGLVVPRVPRLKTLENQSVIRSWLANVEQFCSDMAIPEDQWLRWALSGLEDEAATAWGALIYLRKRASVTFKEMGEMLLQQAYQRHTAYALWGQWTMLRQTQGESGQKYCDRVRDLQAQENMPDL